MKHADFVIGGTFWCGGRQWRCTDIGTRTVIAMRIDSIDVGSNVPELRRTLSRSEAEAEGWFNGPPYAVAESVFDENDMEGCSREPAPDDTGVSLPSPATDDPHVKAVATGGAQATAIREQARAGGLRFEAYLPPDLAEWLIELIARGAFTDPSEAVFVMLGEQQELEPHADLREELLRRSCQAAIDDPRPGISSEELRERIRQWSVTQRPEPAIWRRVPP